MKSFEKPINNRPLDQLEKCGFQYGFRSTWSTVDVVAVVSDRICRAFNSSGATWAVVLYIFKTSDRVWQAALLHRLQSDRISGKISWLYFVFSQ